MGFVICGGEGVAINYYKRHIGDYLRDTAHLSLLEHGVYNRLLDVYYTRETGIPDGQAARLIGARTNDERQAVDVVLSEFFDLRDGVWRQKRCDAEIGISKTKADRNREAGRMGGRPPKTETKREPTNNSDGSISEPTDNPDGFFLETQDEPNTNPTRGRVPLAISHKPLAISQELEKSLEAPVPVAAQKRGTRLPADWRLPDDLRAWAKTSRPDVDPDTEAEKFRDYWHAKSGRDAAKADWPATWRNWIRNANGSNGRHAQPSAGGQVATAIHGDW